MVQLYWEPWIKVMLGKDLRQLPKHMVASLLILEMLLLLVSLYFFKVLNIVNKGFKMERLKKWVGHLGPWWVLCFWEWSSSSGLSEIQVTLPIWIVSAFQMVISHQIMHVFLSESKYQFFSRTYEGVIHICDHLLWAYESSNDNCDCKNRLPQGCFQWYVWS